MVVKSLKMVVTWWLNHETCMLKRINNRGVNDLAEWLNIPMENTMRFNECNEDENGGEIPGGIFIGNLDTNRVSTKLSDDHMQYRNHCKRRYAQKNKWAMLGLKPTLSQDSHASTAGGIQQETWRLQTTFISNSR